MKKTLLKLFLLLTVVCILLSICSCSKNSLPTIGICQYAEHASLDNCRLGFIQGLADSGLIEGEHYRLDYQNAGADDSINQQIASSFVSTNSSLICAIATPSAIACYAQAEEKNIPVIFTAITDVESAGLSTGNVTGTSDKLPVDAQLELIRKMQPEAKKIGIIYTTSEPNSVSSIKEYNDVADKYGFEIEAIGVTSQAEVSQATDTLINKNVDCFSNLTDNNVVSVLPSILEKTNEKNIPVYGSEVEQVKLGCIAAAGIDYYELGKQTGKMAALVFKGEKSASDIPYERISNFSNYINESVANTLGITISAELLETAAKV